MNASTTPAPSQANLSGILLVNKPSGPTSYDMIRWIKRSFRGVKIGHSGTLDPLASGLLIILLGRATKQQDSFMKLEKTYRFTMKVGIQTDSGDLAGKIIKEEIPPVLDENIVRPVLAKFMGPQIQIPPMYSALKKNGTPLYKLARKGETVERAGRAITINELSLLGFKNAVEAEVRARCSSGTYIRTLAEDIGTALGTCAVMSSLVREAIGTHLLENAILGDDLKTLTPDQLASQVRPLAAS